jgi:hypothetical protein
MLREIQEAEPDRPKLREYLDELEMIDRSPSLQKVVIKAVEMAEREFKVPENMAL